MHGPKHLPIELAPRQQAVLEQFSRRRAARAHLVLRARLVLLVAAGLSNSHISRQLGLDRGQVRLWRASARRPAEQVGVLRSALGRLN